MLYSFFHSCQYEDDADSALVIDSHCHILPPSFRDRRAEIAKRDATFAALLSDPNARIASADDLLAAMDRDGVDQAVVMGMGWTDHQVAVEANEYIIQTVADNPGRLTGFCSVNPGWGEPAVTEAQRCFDAGLVGIGELHADTQKFDITDVAAMAPVMELARSDRLPVLVHASEPVGHQYPGKGGTTPDKLYRFIQNFPGNVIICAHWGGGLPFYSLMPEVKESLKNVYFDSAATPFLYRPEVFGAVSELAGAGKVLFASDFPLLEMSRPLEQARNAGLAADVEAALLWGNAAKLFGL
jgi:predicted TIM-barrel fold metal-dependent hydrolase